MPPMTFRPIAVQGAWYEQGRELLSGGSTVELDAEKRKRVKHFRYHSVSTS